MNQENKKIISIPFIIVSVFVILGFLYFYIESSRINEDRLQNAEEQISFLEDAKKESDKRLAEKIKSIENVSDSDNIDDIENELNVDIEIDLSELDDLYEALNLGEFDI